MKPKPTPKPPAKGTAVSVTRARSQVAANKLYNARTARRKAENQIGSEGSDPGKNKADLAHLIPGTASNKQYTIVKNNLNAAEKNYKSAHSAYLMALKKANNPKASANANARRKTRSGKP